LVTSSVSGGTGGDSLVFSAAVKSNTSIAGGGGNDTMVFNSSVSGAAVSLDAGADSVTFVTKVVGSSTLFGGSGIHTVNFSSAADLVTFDGTFGAGSILGGSGNDTIVFLANGAQFNSNASLLKTEAGADSLHFGGNLISGQFGLGAGADNVSGRITVGSGVSFWGGSGNDTFNFSSVSAAGSLGTAYFWNQDSSADSIVFGSAISAAAVGGVAGGIFGVTAGASLNISFITAQTTQAFGKATGAQSTGSQGFGQNFRLANSNVVTYGIDSNNYVTLAFAGGGSLTLQGFSAGEAKGITNTFNLSKGGGNPAGTTASFGTVFSIPTFS
jgi:hypothetical protein